MAYSVERVRFTLECDACGRTEKHDLDDPEERASFERTGMPGWFVVEIRNRRTSFCCPSCVEGVEAVLEKRISAEKERIQAYCEHSYQPRDLIGVERGEFALQCMKCGRFRS